MRRGEQALRRLGAARQAAAGRNVVDPEPEDVEQANRQEYFDPSAEAAGRAEQERPGAEPKELECVEQRGQRVLQLPEEQEREWQALAEPERRGVLAVERLGPVRIRESKEQARLARQQEQAVQRASRQPESEWRQPEREAARAARRVQREVRLASNERRGQQLLWPAFRRRQRIARQHRRPLVHE